MSVGLFVGERCMGPCGNYRSVNQMRNLGKFIRICEDCLARHDKSLDLLAGQDAVTKCQNCHTSIEELQRTDPNPEGARFFVHHLDGIYVALCFKCDQKVTELTKHMLKNTPAGQARKIQ